MTVQLTPRARRSPCFPAPAARRSIGLIALLGTAVWAAACGGDAEADREPGDTAALEVAPLEIPTSSFGGVQAISLLGDTLRASVAPGARAQLLADYEAALDDYEARPSDADAIIWLGRRLGYLQEYGHAIDVFTEGIRLHPDDARMYRHRGHRYISTRQLDLALADFARAAELIEGHPDEVEPDGQPNARGIPTSTLQSNIWYHYGLAQYLRGDFEAALHSYERYLDITTNPDQLVAISHWKYMALRRLGRDAEAAAVLEPITADLGVFENGSYHQLLLMYRGELAPEELWGGQDDALQSATVGYGVANWYLYNGRTDEAFDAFRRVLATGQWSSFGYIAAEAELARVGRG